MSNTLLEIKAAVPKGSWMELLEDLQLLKIHEMLKNGATNSEAIKTCQAMFNVKRKAKLEELLPDIVKFRTQILNDKALLAIEETQGNTAAIQLATRLRGLTSRVDAFGRLNWLVDQQTERVVGMLGKEKKSGLIYPGTTDNIAMLDKMLHNLLKAKSDLNIPEQTVTVSSESNQKLQQLVDGFKNDGEAMINATHKLLDLVDTRSVTLNLDQDGKFTVTEKEEIVVES
jgi:hypothetical protein